MTIKLNLASYWYISIFAIPLGYFIALYEDSGVHNLTIKKLCVLFFVFAFTAYVAILNALTFKPLHFIYNIGFAICLYIAIRVLGFPQTSLLKKLGNISMEIYLLHGIFISFISPLDWNPYIRLVVIVIGSVIAAYSVNKLSILIQRK